MSRLFLPEATSYATKRMFGFVLVLLAGFRCIAHTLSLRKLGPSMVHAVIRNPFSQFSHLVTQFIRFDPRTGFDFRAVYGSCRCLVSGCNPYESLDTRAEFLKQGGSLAETMTSTFGPFMPHFVGYPPPTLFYMTPFAVLRWPVALIAYLLVATSLYVLAVMLFADLCSEYVPLAASACLALFIGVYGQILTVGQPALLAAALLCIGVWCLLKNRYIWLGVLSFAFSLVFKPHIGALFLVYFFLTTRTYRRRAWQVLGLTVILCLPALLWFSTHKETRNWVRDYRTNLSEIAKPGNVSDPGPKNKFENRIIDLQVIVSLYRDVPSFYNRVVWGFSAVVLALWLYPVLIRPPSQEKDILCLAVIAAYSMLPIYHRTYDSRALLILFPAVAVLLQASVWWGRAAAGVTILMSLVLSDTYIKETSPDGSIVPSLGNHPFVQKAVLHGAPVLLLMVAIFYLLVLYVDSPDLALKSQPTSNRIEEAVA